MTVATETKPIPPRFVILHHQLAEGEHWDLMLEHNGVLLTWQLPQNPLFAGALPMPARRIADHRPIYLSYEGPISGDRGTVRRIAGGVLQIHEWAGNRCRFELQGANLTGQFELMETSPDAWRFQVWYDNRAL